MILNEWSTLAEKASACIKFEVTKKESVESLSVKYPQFCFHKAKRVLPLRILETQASDHIAKLQNRDSFRPLF